MAISKVNFNSLNVTPSASKFLAWDGDADALAAADIGGALTLISTNNITSGVASSSFTSNIDSTYDTYLFKLINIHCETNAVDFRFNGSIDSGSNYNVTKTTTFFNAIHQEDGGGGALSYQAGNDLAQSTAAAQFAVALGNDADQSLSATVYLFSPAPTTFVKHFMITSNACHSSDKTQNNFIAGYFNTTSAINAIQFIPESDNIDSGIIKMYGVS